MIEEIKRKYKIPYSTLWYNALRLRDQGLIEFENRRYVKLTELGKVIMYML